MKLLILTPGTTLVDATVERVALPGEVGPFVVLKNHAPLIAALTAGRVAYTPVGGEEQYVTIDRGFVRVEKDVISLCVEQTQS